MRHEENSFGKTVNKDNRIEILTHAIARPKRLRMLIRAQGLYVFNLFYSRCEMA